MAQFVTALVMTFLLIGFYRQYRKTYVYEWTFGWAAIAVTQVGVALGRWAATNLDVAPLHPFRLAPALVANVCAYLSVAWLVFGAYDLVRRRPVKLREAKWILIAAGALGALLTLPYTGDEGTAAGRYLARFGV